jgi:hypothetical protein
MTVWVSAMTLPQAYRLSVVNGGDIFLGAPPIDISADGFYDWNAVSVYTSNPNFGSTFHEPGLYYVLVDCTVGWGPNTPAPGNNALLLLSTWLGQPNAPTAESLWPIGARYPFTPGGVYETGATIENVAFGGLVNVQDQHIGLDLYVKNSSAYTVRFHTLRLTWFNIAPPIA